MQGCELIPGDDIRFQPYRRATYIDIMVRVCTLGT